MDLAVAAAEFAWLWDVEHGTSVGEVSQHVGLSRRRIRQGLSRARGLSSELGDTGAVAKLRPPHLEPVFGILPFTPLSACTRHSWIGPGTCWVCMVCHLTGHEGHPALQRSAYTDPRPEPPPPEPPPDVLPPHRETRKERRARIFGPPFTQPSAA